MQEKAILEIDKSALGLIQALDKYAEELICCMDMEQLSAIRSDVIGLRRAMLGLEMGVLYQHGDYNPEEALKALSDSHLPIDKVAQVLAPKK